ncbi:MAG: phenylacetic acid degradation protein [Actinomycetota bacterium]
MNTANDDHAYEVFAQIGGPGKPITYVGSVRAADPLLAWHGAKEAYTRREDCTVLWVVPRAAIVRSEPGDTLVLGHGSSRRYRMPNYPSGRRRARAKQAGKPAEASAGEE